MLLQVQGPKMFCNYSAIVFMLLQSHMISSLHVCLFYALSTRFSRFFYFLWRYFYEDKKYLHPCPQRNCEDTAYTEISTLETIYRNHERHSSETARRIGIKYLWRQDLWTHVDRALERCLSQPTTCINHLTTCRSVIL